jgi:outer membrane protein W
VKKLISILVLVVLSAEGLGAEKDFKGLFGSYKREKFTENEAHDSDWGMDLSLSSLLPVTSVVKSTTTAGAEGEAMRYSTFFNVEGSLLFSLAYHWQFYASVGHFSYDTRKENVSKDAAQALFHQFEFNAIPILVGARYRFGLEDIVPYIGLGAGVSRVTRKGFYDTANSAVNEQTENMLTGQIQGGVEFYFSPRAGLRLEIAAHYFNAKKYTFDGPGSGDVFPDMIYQPNVVSVRYASGLFFLF